MKKVIIFLAVMAVLLAGINAFAKEDGNLSFEKAKNDLLVNNTALKKANNIERQTYLNYKDSLSKYGTESAQSPDIQDLYRYYDDYSKMLVTKQREFLRIKAINDWENAKSNVRITQNNLIVGLRDVLIKVVSSCNNLKIEQIKFNQAEKIWKINKSNFAKGKMTSENANESDYNYLKAKGELNAAIREKENSLRDYASFVGLPADVNYSDVDYKEEMSPKRLKTAEEYIKTAAAERQEIISLEQDISLNQSQLKILEQDRVNLVYPDVAKEHSDVLFDIDVLNAKTEKVKYDIEKEIRSAYIDVYKQAANIKSQKNILDVQERNLQKVMTQFSKGLIAATAIDQYKIGVAQAENDYYCAIFNYNTAVMKLENASGAGPAYFN